MRSIAPWRVVAGSLLGLVAGCGGGNVTPRDASYEPMPQEAGPVDTGSDSGDSASVDGAQCAVVIAQHTDEGAYHIACTSPTTYQTMPPSSGNHFGCWPEYRTFDVPVPWGNLVHALEHGAVVIVYNCATTDPSCADEVARAQAWIDALPADPDCPGSHRIIMAPDPTLTVRWAATAWQWTLRADCFDESAFTQFYSAHYGAGREVVCSSGGTPEQWCP